MVTSDLGKEKQFAYKRYSQMIINTAALNNYPKESVIFNLGSKDGKPHAYIEVR